MIVGLFSAVVRTIAGFALVLMLAACGGGGDESGLPTATSPLDLGGQVVESGAPLSLASVPALDLKGDVVEFTPTSVGGAALAPELSKAIRLIPDPSASNSVILPIVTRTTIGELRVVRAGRIAHSTTVTLPPLANSSPPGALFLAFLNGTLASVEDTEALVRSRFGSSSDAWFEAIDTLQFIIDSVGKLQRGESIPVVDGQEMPPAILEFFDQTVLVAIKREYGESDTATGDTKAWKRLQGKAVNDVCNLRESSDADKAFCLASRHSANTQRSMYQVAAVFSLAEVVAVSVAGLGAVAMGVAALPAIAAVGGVMAGVSVMIAGMQMLTTVAMVDRSGGGVSCAAESEILRDQLVNLAGRGALSGPFRTFRDVLGAEYLTNPNINEGLARFLITSLPAWQVGAETLLSQLTNFVSAPDFCAETQAGVPSAETPAGVPTIPELTGVSVSCAWREIPSTTITRDWTREISMSGESIFDGRLRIGLVGYPSSEWDYIYPPFQDPNSTVTRGTCGGSYWGFTRAFDATGWANSVTCSVTQGTSFNLILVRFSEADTYTHYTYPGYERYNGPLPVTTQFLVRIEAERSDSQIVRRYDVPVVCPGLSP